MKKPNVILISIDTLRADHLSCYGYSKPTTPNIDRLSAEGTIFRYNYSTGVWTPPGHASMLTGLYVSEHGVYDTRRLANDVPTIAEVLKRQGYQTAGFVNNSQVGELVGLDRGHDKFVEVWKGIETDSLAERVVRGLIRRTRKIIFHQDRGAERTNREFMDWLSNGMQTEKPFYAFLHYIEPHNPLNPPNPYRDKYLKDVEPGDIDRGKIKKAAHNPLICFVEDLGLNSREIAYLVALYDGEIEYTDSKIGEIVSFLKDRGLYDDTMIIVTADHGEHFGEHGLWSHVASLYKEVLHIPLIIKFPKGCKCAGEVSEYTQLVDIFPTVMDAAGISGKDEIKTSGVSLVHNGRNRYHEYVFAEWEGRVPSFIQDKARESSKEVDIERFRIQMSMVQDRLHKYVWKSDGTEELFEISGGKDMSLDVSTGKNFRDSLRIQLLERKKDFKERDAEERTMDEDVEKNLKALGYL